MLWSPAKQIYLDNSKLKSQVLENISENFKRVTTSEGNKVPFKKVPIQPRRIDFNKWIYHSKSVLRAAVTSVCVAFTNVQDTLALQRNLSSSKENGMRTRGSNKGSSIVRIQEGFLAGGVDLGLQMILPRRDRRWERCTRKRNCVSAGGRWEVQSPLDRARHLGYVRNAVRMKEEGTNPQKLPEARPKRASDAKLRGLNCTEAM